MRYNRHVMSAIWQHARTIGEPLADSLARLEARSSAIEPDAVRRSVMLAWATLLADCEHGRGNLSSGYLADLHGRLATVAGAEAPGEFAEDGLPLLDDGRPTSWTRFAPRAGGGRRLSPLRGFVLRSVEVPRLAPWATFCRRYAAGDPWAEALGKPSR
jgi:hypothetical protein